MPSCTDSDNAEHVEQTIPATSSGERKGRRKRLQLSCGECRKKKLSCNRTLPCQRCVRSGRPEQCSFETGIGHANSSSSHLAQQHQAKEIRNLRSEVAQLKDLLSKAQSQHDGNGATKPVDVTSISQVAPPTEQLVADEQTSAHGTKTDISDPRNRSPRGYYSKHVLFRFFSELPRLFPFIKESYDEWLKPLGVHIKRNRAMQSEWRKDAHSQDDNLLEILLPPKADADVLVSFYLNHFEQLHRVVHIPTFRREYANYWMPESTRYPAMTALILSVISISTCLTVDIGDSSSVLAPYKAMAVQWISACDDWLSEQSSKYRKLVHYQVSCLVYFAKRINLIRKKKFWMETGSLIQSATMDGLHREPSPKLDNPYTIEIKRRIWVVLREIDLQNAFEYGLPSLLHNIESNVVAPANIDDEDFNEGSQELPTSKQQSYYTHTSYQYHSSRSWELRLEISRCLSSTGVFKTLEYEDVLRYTHDLTQAISSLPSWEVEQGNGANENKLAILSHAFLYFQLTECILAIHRPYLQRENSKFWLSENTCFQFSRDILFLNEKLRAHGIQGLAMLRDDLLLASLTLVRVTMLQPRDSTSIIMTSFNSTIDLLEQGLPNMEDLYLRCAHGEPWCYVTMCAAMMLLKIYVGNESFQAARATFAERFLDLYYRQNGKQQASLQGQAQPLAREFEDRVDTLLACQLPTPSTMVFPMSAWLDSNYPDIEVNPFDLDVELDPAWESWDFTCPT